jgi:putative transposase
VHDADRLCYLELLGKLSERHACRIHAYVLMGNHVHLLTTPDTADAISLLMKDVGQRYAQYVNRAYGRTGGLWEGRFRSSFVETERYLLCCQRYIELNPVRAGMVTAPGDYPWSSHRSNALGHADHIVEPHEEYLRLGLNPAERRAAYRALFAERIEDGVLTEIRTATNGGYALGSSHFAHELAQRLGRRVSQGRPGRPSLKNAPMV